MYIVLTVGTEQLLSLLTESPGITLNFPAAAVLPLAVIARASTKNPLKGCWSTPSRVTVWQKHQSVEMYLWWTYMASLFWFHLYSILTSISFSRFVMVATFAISEGFNVKDIRTLYCLETCFMLYGVWSESVACSFWSTSRVTLHQEYHGAQQQGGTDQQLHGHRYSAIF